MNQNQTESKPEPVEQRAGKGLDETPCSSIIAENVKLRAILKKLVAMDDMMNDEDYDECGTYAGAYYSYYKGESATWDEARALLTNSVIS